MDEHGEIMTPAVAPGDRLKDRYDVIGHIGSGGMADVYQGIDNLFLRDVAIKVLKPERVDEVMKRRVLREARATCAVDHPHMLRITDMGFVGEAPFLVSDLLQGHSLAEELHRAPRGRLDWRRVVRLMLPAMAALHEAHEAGLVHRDIKPENLFLHRRQSQEVLTVLDLGIVKHVALDGTPLRWTRTGIILGTALYMAPEQAAGGHVDRRSDVYAMGVTLHRLLSGQHLFPPAQGDGPIPAMTHHIYEPPPRLGRGFPRALVDAVHTAVAKDPDRRPATMAAFAALLSACLAEDEARATTVERWLQRAGCVGLGAVLGLGPLRLSRDDVSHAAPTVPRASLVAPSPPAELPPEDLADPPAPAPPGGGETPPATTPAAAAPATPPVRDATDRAPRTSRRPRPPDELTRAGAAVRRCMRNHGDLDTHSLRVQVTVGRDGRVVATQFMGPFAASFLGACVRDRLAAIRFAPGAPRVLEHTYHLARNDPKKDSP